MIYNKLKFSNNKLKFFQPAFTCSKSTTGRAKQCVKCIQRHKNINNDKDKISKCLK